MTIHDVDWVLAITAFVVPFGAGVAFTKWIAPWLCARVWFNALSDGVLNRLSLVGCCCLFASIWAQIYLGLAQFWFILIYSPSCALLAFSLVRAHDKGGSGAITVNIAFVLMTLIGLLL